MTMDLLKINDAIIVYLETSKNLNCFSSLEEKVLEYRKL